MNMQEQVAINSEYKTLMPRNKVVVGIVGDSGDGIQVIGTQLTKTASLKGMDINSLPNYPAEIRAPAGTVSGVSGYQLQIASTKEFTIGDSVDVLIAMNPAALKLGIKNLSKDAMIILNSDSMTENNFKKAGFDSATDLKKLSPHHLIEVPITSLTKEAVTQINIPHSQAMKCKNMFALGAICWLVSFDLDAIINWINQRFAKDLEVLAANLAAVKAGYNYADTSELFFEKYVIKPEESQKRTGMQISGNEAFVLACLSLLATTKRPFLLSGYPITPASSVLQFATKYRDVGLQVFQAEDEIAAIAASIGAAFGGALGVTVTSGPGFDLKTEGIGLAVMTELPLLIIDVQRAGPSTGLPTKPEQSDLLAAVYGRHGEAPVPVLAPATPGDCFNILLEAFTIAVNYMTPVIILSDAHLANASEYWELPDLAVLPDLSISAINKDEFQPYERDPITLARPWAVPGMKGLEHRIGGLEKEHITGNVSYDPENHQLMVKLRAEKIQNIVKSIKNPEVIGAHEAKVLILSWGSTYGTVLTATKILQQEGQSVSLLHLRHLNPLPSMLQDILQNFDKVIIPELNQGQLAKLIRDRYLIDTISYNKVTGQPFLISELYEFIKQHV